MKVLKNTRSLCPECLRIISAQTVVKDQIVYIRKRCQWHGEYLIRHIWDCEMIYREMLELNRRPAQEANGLVINLTNRCDLKCNFCYSRSNEVDILEPEISLVEKIFKRYDGQIIYFSGGEPTLRKDLFEFITLAKKKGFKVGLFTHGKRLAEKEYVKRLKDAGIDFVILQFDSLDDELNEFIRGERLLEFKKKTIANLRYYKIPVYLFVLLIKRSSQTEIRDLIRFMLKNRDLVKIINFNPVWELGRLARHEVLTTSMILKFLKDEIGISEQDFISSTKFSFLLFDVLQKISSRRNNVQACCEIRCYVLFTGGEIIPLAKILDLGKINLVLEKIVKRSNSIIGFWFWFIFYSPIGIGILFKELLVNPYFRELLKELMKNIFFQKFKLSLFSISPLRSIIVGTFQTLDNIDFDLLATCNLYSDIPKTQTPFSACVRQILLECVQDGERYKDIKPEGHFLKLREEVLNRKTC